MSDDKDSRDGIWDADYMIESAESLRRAAKKLEKGLNSEEQDPLLFQGMLLASPILLSLAAEIALKAWWCREQENKPAKIHDLRKLYDGLGEGTREILEAKMRKVSPYSIRAGDPKAQNLRPDIQYVLGARTHPLRDILDEHRDANMHWRFRYEQFSARFETAEIHRALTVIIDAYCEKWSYGA